jgi:hypothetical protein
MATLVGAVRFHLVASTASIEAGGERTSQSLRGVARTATEMQRSMRGVIGIGHLFASIDPRLMAIAQGFRGVAFAAKGAQGAMGMLVLGAGGAIMAGMMIWKYLNEQARKHRELLEEVRVGYEELADIRERMAVIAGTAPKLPAEVQEVLKARKDLEERARKLLAGGDVRKIMMLAPAISETWKETVPAEEAARTLAAYKEIDKVIKDRLAREKEMADLVDKERKPRMEGLEAIEKAIIANRIETAMLGESTEVRELHRMRIEAEAAGIDTKTNALFREYEAQMQLLDVINQSKKLAEEQEKLLTKGPLTYGEAFGADFAEAENRLKRVQDLLKQARTPAEEFQDAMKELHEFFLEGLLSADEYLKLVRGGLEDFQKLSGAMEIKHGEGEATWAIGGTEAYRLQAAQTGEAPVVDIERNILRQVTQSNAYLKRLSEQLGLPA